MDAKVTVSIEDFDRLREAEKECDELKRRLAACTDIVVADVGSPSIDYFIDKEKMIGIAKQYACYRKYDYDWIDTVESDITMHLIDRPINDIG